MISVYIRIPEVDFFLAISIDNKREKGQEPTKKQEKKLLEKYRSSRGFSLHQALHKYIRNTIENIHILKSLAEGRILSDVNFTDIHILCSTPWFR